MSRNFSVKKSFKNCVKNINVKKFKKSVLAKLVLKYKKICVKNTKKSVLKIQKICLKKY